LHIVLQEHAHSAINQEIYKKKKKKKKEKKKGKLELESPAFWPHLQVQCVAGLVLNNISVL
jgi:hypothetical protein